MLGCLKGPTFVPSLSANLQILPFVLLPQPFLQECWIMKWYFFGIKLVSASDWIGGSRVQGGVGCFWFLHRGTWGGRICPKPWHHRHLRLFFSRCYFGYHHRLRRWRSCRVRPKPRVVTGRVRFCLGGRWVFGQLGSGWPDRHLVESVQSLFVWLFECLIGQMRSEVLAKVFLMQDREVRSGNLVHHWSSPCHHNWSLRCSGVYHRVCAWSAKVTAWWWLWCHLTTVTMTLYFGTDKCLGWFHGLGQINLKCLISCCASCVSLGIKSPL